MTLRHGNPDGPRFGEGKHRLCGAQCKRSGLPCRSPAVRGSRRCRMHGGAKGSGQLTPEGRARQRIAVSRNGMYCGPGHPIYDTAGPEWRGWAESRRSWRASALILATAPETREIWAPATGHRGRRRHYVRDARGRFSKPLTNDEMASLVYWSRASAAVVVREASCTASGGD